MLQLQVALLIYTGLLGLLALLVLLVCSTAKMSTQRPMVSLGIRAEAEFAWSSLKSWSSQVLEAQFVIAGCTNSIIELRHPKRPNRRCVTATDRC